MYVNKSYDKHREIFRAQVSEEWRISSSFPVRMMNYFYCRETRVSETHRYVRIEFIPHDW